MQRMTSQKQIILDFIKKTTVHPTAEQVFLEIQKKLPHISQATVYRILNTFVKNGIIQNITGKKTHFDGNQKIHQHFICNKCEKIFDIFDNDTTDFLEKKQKNIKNGKIKNFELTFYGICNKCNKNMQFNKKVLISRKRGDKNALSEKIQ